MIRILADFFIIAVMGHRLEPWSQALSRFKRTLENKFQEYVIHFECYPPLLPLYNPLDSSESASINLE